MHYLCPWQSKRSRYVRDICKGFHLTLMFSIRWVQFSYFRRVRGKIFLFSLVFRICMRRLFDFSNATILGRYRFNFGDTALLEKCGFGFWNILN